jgi:hypothetical protein
VVDAFTILGAWMWASFSHPHHLALDTGLITNWNTIWQITKRECKIFLQSLTILRYYVETIVFIVKAIGTLVVVPYYENLVCTIETLCFSKEYKYKYPLVSRFQGLILTFCAGFLCVQTFTILGMVIGTVLGIFKNRILSTSM